VTSGCQRRWPVAFTPPPPTWSPATPTGDGYLRASTGRRRFDGVWDPFDNCPDIANPDQLTATAMAPGCLRLYADADRDANANTHTYADTTERRLPHLRRHRQKRRRYAITHPTSRRAPLRRPRRHPRRRPRRHQPRVNVHTQHQLRRRSCRPQRRSQLRADGDAGSFSRPDTGATDTPPLRQSLRRHRPRPRSLHSRHRRLPHHP
jgi:hypothetical protein